jgi:hypothetical protein
MSADVRFWLRHKFNSVQPDGDPVDLSGAGAAERAVAPEVPVCASRFCSLISAA